METNSIFEEIESYPERGTYISDVIPRAGGSAYLVDFIEGSEEEGPKVATSSFGAEFTASSIMYSLTMGTLMNQLEKYGVPSTCTPILPGQHCQSITLRRVILPSVTSLCEQVLACLCSHTLLMS